MRARQATRADINEFYKQKRLAVVGVSRNAKEYSRMIFAELRKQGYDAVPVNPKVGELDGMRCYSRVTDVAPAVESAMVLLPAQAGLEALRDCAQAGIKRVWLRYSVPGAAELCREQGITLVSGYCPFMFMPGSHFFHQCHAFGLKVVGAYPN
ncbi:MAG: CoA-binding protein [Chloroflexota bacterium]